MNLDSAFQLAHSTFSRRELLQRLGGGVGTVGLAALLAPAASAAAGGPHFKPRRSGSFTCS
jgi:hypothetical protein